MARSIAIGIVIVVPLAVVLANWSSTPVIPTTSAACSALPTDEIQGFEQQTDCVSGVDAITCFGINGSNAPTSSLTCPNNSDVTVTPLDTSLTSWYVVKADRGHRWYSAVTFAPKEWGFDPGTPGQEVGRVTMRTDIQCDDDSISADIFADSGSQPTASAWPNPTAWNGFPITHNASVARDPRTAVKAPPAPFTTVSMESVDGGLDYMYLLGEAAVTIPNVQYLGRLQPVDFNVVTDESPYENRLRVTSFLFGDPGPPTNDFSCLDGPYDLVVKSTQWRSPQSEGLYPRWTVLTSLPDIRSGRVSKVLDVQCVRVGPSPPADSDGDCLDNDAAYGTNPTLADTDGDHLIDGLEVAFGSSPLVADSDGDGSDDWWELLQYTDPTQIDSDGDGLSDRQWTWATGETGSRDNCPAVFNPLQTNSDSRSPDTPDDATALGGVLLTASMGSSDTTASVETTSPFPSSGKVVIEGDTISYTVQDGTALNLQGAHAAHTKFSVVSLATTLTASVNSNTPDPSATVDFPVASTDGFAASGYLYVSGAYIGGEFIHYTSKSDSPAKFVVDSRGLGDTFSQTWYTGTAVIPAVDPSDTSLTLASTTGISSSGGTFSIDGERVRYAGRDATTGQPTGVTRGAEGTRATYHAGATRLVKHPDYALPIPARSSSRVTFPRDYSNPHADIYGDACDNDADNDWITNIGEALLHIQPWAGRLTTSCTDNPNALNHPLFPPYSGYATVTPSVFFGTPADPANADSDQDLALDGAECVFGSRPDLSDTTIAACYPTPSTYDQDGCAFYLGPQTGEDYSDADLLFAPGDDTGLAERAYRTDGIEDPLLFPTGANDNPDGDGYSPGAADNDSDNDGLKDGWEVRYYGTSPTDFDTDGDGCSDGDEAGDLDGSSSTNAGDQLTLTLFGILNYRDASGFAPSFLASYDVDKNGAINSGDKLLIGLIIAIPGNCSPTRTAPEIVRFVQ